ncbi:anti sigma factor C-terminal domain-containing protein [Clostridium culturomicium]|uniref:anti sigma factor C-terminal domain-containing protein n=1 Tax=Clostridium culturomicium TaxID=1499683 RepID=UPI0005917099|nr:anti sigma factor C-terminal domain-containing protein [Clostridium culturomicium]
MKDMDNIFDDKKLKQSVRKAKAKSTIKIICISLVVFIAGSFINTAIGIKYSKKSYEAAEAYVSVSVPGGYISESTDFIVFLGGNGNYKITKNIGNKPVILEDRVSFFGLIPQIAFFRGTGAGYHDAGQWPVSIWENGYRKMRFFHPNIEYVEYQNDLDEIDKIPDDKIIEMAISFDKPYKMTELFTIQNKLSPAKIYWVWLNEFTEEKMKHYENEVVNYDSKANGIKEDEAIGISIPNKDRLWVNPYDQYYDALVENLEKSYMPEHQKLYEEIMARGKTKMEDAEVLGVIVQGTKEELKQLVENPMVKATSIGVVVDPLY